MRRIAAVALMLLPVAGDAEGIWTTMTGTEIAQALTDRTLVYTKAEQVFHASGVTVYLQNGRESRGSWRVDNNQYCSQWPPQGLWACYHMDRSGQTLRFIGAGGDITVGTYTSQ